MFATCLRMSSMLMVEISFMFDYGVSQFTVQATRSYQLLGRFSRVTESGWSAAQKPRSWAHSNQVNNLMTLLVVLRFLGRV